MVSGIRPVGCNRLREAARLVEKVHAKPTASLPTNEERGGSEGARAVN